MRPSKGRRECKESYTPKLQVPEVEYVRKRPGIERPTVWLVVSHWKRLPLNRYASNFIIHVMYVFALTGDRRGDP